MEVFGIIGRGVEPFGEDTVGRCRSEPDGRGGGQVGPGKVGRGIGLKKCHIRPPALFIIIVPRADNCRQKSTETLRSHRDGMLVPNHDSGGCVTSRTATASAVDLLLREL
jgi:hypothetical protein